MASELVRQLIDAGIHFGHRASRWNPKMAPYIFGKRNTIHIIDIRETVKGLLRAKKFIAKIVAGGDDILLVGTKRQARILVREAAEKVGMPFVVDRWLGGTLTNFQTIRSRVTRLDELELAETDGTSLEYSKKMVAMRARELRKIRRNLGGIRYMHLLPGALLIIDVQREKNAVREAKKLGIPTVALIDTDSDPDFADVPIPGNDDAMRAIGVILEHVVEAIELGKKARKAPPAPKAERQERPEKPDVSAVPRRRVGSPVAPAGGSALDAKPVAVAEKEPEPVTGATESPTPAAAAEPETAP